jgi:hypothetical protein
MDAPQTPLFADLTHLCGHHPTEKQLAVYAASLTPPEVIRRIVRESKCPMCEAGER